MKLQSQSLGLEVATLGLLQDFKPCGCNSKILLAWACSQEGRMAAFKTPYAKPDAIKKARLPATSLIKGIR